jgi:DNA-binding NarL/FixJ family response regulator
MLQNKGSKNVLQKKILAKDVISKLSNESADLARAMRQEGKSYRQIAEELGYKSISSIHTLLKQE